MMSKLHRHTNSIRYRQADIMKILVETSDGKVSEVELNVEVDPNTEIINVKLKDDWTVVGDQLIYCPSTYIQRAQKYLDENPPDLKQAAEKIWGLMAHLIKHFYLQIGIGIKSHRGIRALGLFMFKFTDKTGELSYLFRDAEYCHKSFYSLCLTKFDLIEILDKMKDAIPVIEKVSMNDVKKQIDPYIYGRISTETDLEGITFSHVNHVEKSIGKCYDVKICAS